MSRRKRAVREASQAIRQWTDDPRRARRHRRKRARFARIVKAILAMVISALVVLPAMIGGGFLLGPHGYEGLLIAPLVLFSIWGAILYWALRRRVTPKAIVKAEIAQLPAQTEEWLEEQRHRLPSSAQSQLDNLAQRLEDLTPQVQTLSAETAAAVEVRRLLAEELPELVRGYHKVPRGLSQQPLYGGATPERQLIEGLETIEKQIGRVHERLATEDLHALATHQRYLELKYNRKDEPE